MKRELKIGGSQIITISDSGAISIPNNIKMSINEIAELFGIYYQTAKRNIRTIEKSSIADGDASMGSIVEGLNVHPDYYGLEMIIAVAFRVQSAKAEIFRKWVTRKATKIDLLGTFLLSFQNPVLN